MTFTCRNKFYRPLNVFVNQLKVLIEPDWRSALVSWLRQTWHHSVALCWFVMLRPRSDEIQKHYKWPWPESIHPSGFPALWSRTLQRCNPAPASLSQLQGPAWFFTTSWPWGVCFAQSLSNVRTKALGASIPLSNLQDSSVLVAKLPSRYPASKPNWRFRLERSSDVIMKAGPFVMIPCVGIGHGWWACMDDDVSSQVAEVLSQLKWVLHIRLVNGLDNPYLDEVYG